MINICDGQYDYKQSGHESQHSKNDDYETVICAPKYARFGFLHALTCRL